jgi:EAL domain-containing protein (putative c-di-GMP-specific phosphodiesterase class I)
MSCEGCREVQTLPALSMAFQPIVDITDGSIYAYEALVRGPQGQSAHSVLSAVNDANRYAFDQQCRVRAIELATGLGLQQKLSINFLPNAVYEPRACIRMTLEAASKFGLSSNQIIFEFTEQEKVDPDHLLNILRDYRAMGLMTAIDDFGAGYSGLDLLARFQPDIVKLDMDLIRGIREDRVRRIIVAHVLAMLNDLGVMPICEGVETPGEMETIGELGVRLAQGYLFARPGFQSLPPANVPNRHP